MTVDSYIIYWTMSICLIQAIPRQKSYRKLTKSNIQNIKVPDEEFKYMVLEISSWDFCRYLFVCCVISFSLLYFLTNQYVENILIKSGILIPFWLCLTGMLTRHLYFIYGITRKWKHYKMLNEEQMQVFWISIPIMVNFVYIFHNIELALMVTAIIIGKFIWLDFVINPKIIEKNIIQYITTNRVLFKVALEFIFIGLISGIFVLVLQKIMLLIF